MTAKQRKGVQHPYLAGGDNTEWFLNASSTPPASAPGGSNPTGPPRICLLPGLCL